MPRPREGVLGSQKTKMVGHFKKRLMERFGVTVTDEELEDEAKKIDEYENKPLLIEKDGRSFHFVIFNSVELLALFDWDQMCFVTAYYKSWLKKGRSGDWIRYWGAKSKTIREKDHHVTRFKKMGIKPTNDFVVRREVNGDKDVSESSKKTNRSRFLSNYKRVDRKNRK